LDALYSQTFPRSRMEVVLADGLSSDRTRNVIEAFAREHPDMVLKVVDNPKRIIPAGLNRAIQAACGEIIVRMDAHSMPYPEYIERCVQAVEANAGDNVGGIWEILPADGTWDARSIAAAASHPLGVGDARYRLGGNPQRVDTVPFGAFRRSLVEQIGFFDETLLTNEDYEFNVRVRQAGGVVWLDPEIRSQYFARPNLAALFRQYWRYGYWKARMLRRYAHTLRWRQLLPPVFVLSLLLLILLSLIYPEMSWLLMVELSSYIIVILSAGIHTAAKKRDIALIAGVPLAIATMHLAWGGAFLWSLIKPKFKSENP
jgi:cellulose synthase/poly-beta-1,6-N-acetylglucosamine synthase-like glycosyltransferase